MPGCALTFGAKQSMATYSFRTAHQLISPPISRKKSTPLYFSLRTKTCSFGHGKLLDYKSCRPIRSQARTSTDLNASPGGEAQVSPPPAIRIKNLRLSLTTPGGEKLRILEDCSLEIPEGQLWMLLGPNGCGKSTLLKVIQSYRTIFFEATCRLV